MKLSRRGLFGTALGGAACASVSGALGACYQTRIGAHQHRTWQWNKKPLAPPVRHMCEWFRDAGYLTCNLQPANVRQRTGNPLDSVHGAAGSGKVDLNFLANGADAARFFDGIDWKQRQPDQPFFAHITIIETHKGVGWKIAREQPKSELVDPAKVKLASYYPDSPIARDEYANYLDAIHLSDGYVGQLLDRLEREGLADNTVVLISSDHGPLFRGKQFLYDGGLHIPLMIRFPDGRGAGTVNEDFVSAIDFAPTLLGFAGIRPPAGAMEGQDTFEPDFRNYLPAIPYMQTNPYKEAEYPTWNLVKEWCREGKLNAAQALFAAPEKPFEELYDLRADPDEVRNLAKDPKQKETLVELRTLVDGFVRENDQRVVYEDPLDIYRGYYGHLPEDPPGKRAG